MKKDIEMAKTCIPLAPSIGASSKASPRGDSSREASARGGQGSRERTVFVLSNHCISKLLISFITISSLFIFTSCTPNRQKPLDKVEVIRGDILAQLSTTGVVIPRNRLSIKPPVSGRIEEVLVREGESVKKGQTLAWMSSSERAALLDSARAKGPEEVKYWTNVYKPAPIIAPLDGFIIKRNMEPGQFFNLNDDVLVMADELIVQAQVDETDIGRIKLNQEAKIILDSYPNNEASGRVERIAYESELINNVTVYKVDVFILNIPKYFRSGMSATINFLIEKKKNVLLLPANAVKRKGNRSYIFIESNDKIRTKQVKTGLEDGKNIEVDSELSEGDKVIIPTPKILKETIEQSRMRTPMNIFGRRKK